MPEIGTWEGMCTMQHTTVLCRAFFIPDRTTCDGLQDHASEAEEQRTEQGLEGHKDPSG